MPGAGVYMEEALLQLLRDTDLLQFQSQICVDLHVRKLEHFDHVKDKDLLAKGIPQPAIRRLRAALKERKRLTSRKRDSDSQMRHMSVENNENFEPDGMAEASIPREQIKLMERMGEGTFAVVKRAIWTRSNGSKVDVAVKILRDASPLVMEELQAEAANLRRLQHPNLIRLYGVVENPAMMVTELCPGGSLLERLRARDKPTLLVTQLLEYCKQMCKGMTYLESRHCVHRDLAARNILLSQDEQTIKICDFGLMRVLEDNERLYVMSPSKKVPFAWCPPEALRHRQFSHASDVWSMGVAMWEIFTYGEEPWVGLRSLDVLQKVEAGERLAKPRQASQQLYDLMLLCWKLSPDHRPRFNLLRGFLNQIEMPLAVVRESFDSQEPGSLFLQPNDEVIVIDNTGVMWKGQSRRTRLIGNFPRSSIFVKTDERRERDTHSSTTPRKTPHITLPIKGSFIHAAHGDITGGGWGQPNVIDDIYLSNPVLGTPLVAVGNTATILSPSSSSKPATLAKPSTFPSMLNSMELFDDFDDDDFFPSTIHIPGPSIPSNASFSSFPSHPSPHLVPSRIAPPVPHLHPHPPPHPYYNPPSDSSSLHNGLFPSSSVHASHAYSSSANSPSVPRPSATNQRSQSATRSADRTPPPLNASAFISNTKPGIDLVKTNAFNNANYPVNTGTNGNVSLMNELSARLRNGSTGEVTWRSSPQETPLLNQSVMSTPRPMSYSTAPDPFTVPESVRSLTQPRHSEYLSRLPSSSSSSTPSTVAPSLPVKTQSSTAVPSSVPSKTSSSSPSALLPSQPLQPSPLPSRVPLPFPSQNQPSIPPTLSSHSTPTPTQPSLVPSSSSSPRPLPSSTPIVPQPSHPPTSSHYRVPMSNPSVSTTRGSTVIDESNSFLPPPSALFYGSTNNSSLRSSPVSSSTTNPSSSVLPPSSLPPSTLSQPSSRPTPPMSTAVALRPTQAPLPSASTVLLPTRDPSSRSSPSLPSSSQAPSRPIIPSTIPSSSSFTPSISQPPPPYQQTQVPLFALNNSTRSAQFNPHNQYNQYGAYPSTMMNMNMNPSNGYGGFGNYFMGTPMYGMGQQSSTVTLPSLGPPITPSIQVPENASREEVIRLLDPLSSSSSSSTTVSRSSSPGRRMAEMESLYSEAFFTDRSRCDWMVSQCNGRVDEALRRLKKEYMVDTGIARDLQQAEAALIAKDWNLNSAADAILTGSI